MTRRIAVSLVLTGALTTAAFAAEGRIPIYEPTTITESGRYFVTRVLVAPPGSPVIDIATGDVDIDLNGFLLLGSDAAVIRAADVSGIVVRNGNLAEGVVGVEARRVRKIVIEDLRINASEQAGIFLEESVGYRIARNEVRDIYGSDGGGIVVQATGVIQGFGVIEDNTIELAAGGIRVIDGSNVTLRGNSIGHMSNRGIAIEGCHGCSVSDNNVTYCTSYCVQVRDCYGCRVSQNVIVFSEFQEGIRIDGNSVGNLVHDNTVSLCGGAGIVVASNRHQIERNVLTDNGTFGLWFQGPSLLSTFGRNTARGNGGGACLGPGTSDFCDDGIGNSSFGDNFVPNLY